MSRARLIACVLLPFAAGYYLSYLFRTINALIAGDLTAELGLSAADLGFLTSVYFLVFAAVQLPFGVLLDRYGPRTIQSALLLLASAGALVFALADGLVGLAGRPRVDRTRRRLGADGRLQGHRAVVSAGADCTRQRLARHAGRARRRDGHGTGRARRASASAGAACSLCWPACRAVAALLVLFVVPDCRPAEAQTASASQASASGRSTAIARFWRLAPLSAARHRHVLVAAGSVGRTLAEGRRRPRSRRRGAASERSWRSPSAPARLLLGIAADRLAPHGHQDGTGAGMRRSALSMAGADGAGRSAGRSRRYLPGP